MTYRYDDAFVVRLTEQMGDLIDGDTTLADEIRAGLIDLARANSPQVADYWRRTETGRGIPENAFKGAGPDLFPDRPAARVFYTGGATGAARGQVKYTDRGLELMKRSILASARAYALTRTERAPAMLRLLPDPEHAPGSAVAFAADLIARELGDPAATPPLMRAEGIDFFALCDVLEQVTVARRPTVLIGSGHQLKKICDAMQRTQSAWELPKGSRAIHVGTEGPFSERMEPDVLRRALDAAFAIPPEDCVNLFGMTELASQLYDAETGPGERAKRGLPFVSARVRDPGTLEVRPAGVGHLEVSDLCVIDRPHVVLTGDVAEQTEAGVRIVGRVPRGQRRIGSLSFDAKR